MAASNDRLYFLRPFVLLSCLGIVLCLLYFAKAVLIPLALAVLLTFLLAPAVTSLQRRGLPRIPAVLVVVLVAFVLFAGIGWVVASQATLLVDSFPQYEENLEEKIETLRAMGRGGFLQKVQVVMDRIRQKIEQPAKAPSADSPPVAKPVPLPVRVVDDDSPFNLAEIWTLTEPLLAPIGTAGVVVVLVIFLLIRREDMRDRLIGLLGRGRLTLTTKALDEAGYRISRYLLMQLIINSGVGLAVAIGLFVIQVPYAPLWGFLAAILRYIPYLGPWLAATLPFALSVLITHGWTTPLLVAGLFIVIEVTSNMFLEPWLYGRNVGVSDAASIVALAFWTWLWGPVGLVLAFPLTVCLVVLGRYVPSLKFLDTLFGDRPALEPHVGFYQRLLARDQDEALEIAEDRLHQSSLLAVYDELAVPALNYARRDLDGDLISESEHRALLSALSDVAGDLSEHHRTAAKSAAAKSATDQQPDQTHSPLPPISVLACPARDETDEVALRLLEDMIDREKFDIVVTSSALLSTELMAEVEDKQIKMVCIGAVPPGGSAHARYLCKRLRSCCPDVKILVGRWGLKSPLDMNREELQSAGADYVGFSIEETCNQMLALAPVLAAQQLRQCQERELSGDRLEQPATPETV